MLGYPLDVDTTQGLHTLSNTPSTCQAKRGQDIVNIDLVLTDLLPIIFEKTRTHRSQKILFLQVFVLTTLSTKRSFHLPSKDHSFTICSKYNLDTILPLSKLRTVMASNWFYNTAEKILQTAQRHPKTTSRIKYGAIGLAIVCLTGAVVVQAYAHNPKGSEY